VIDTRVERWLQDFLAFAKDADELIVTHGQQEFLTDRTKQLAAEAILHRLGEIVARLPQDFIVGHPDVSWRAIKGMRNVVAQEYQVIDYQIVWNALAVRLPADAARIHAIVTDGRR
jgi:uncharacterized protein with HEPN domain